MSNDDRAAAQQRQFFRALVEFPVTMLVAGNGDEVAARAHDLSGAGIRIATKHTLDRGQAVVLRFRLPDGSAELEAHGTIVLSFFEGASGMFQHGIAFTRISAADREAIVAYIYEVQRRAPKK